MEKKSLTQRQSKEHDCKIGQITMNVAQDDKRKMWAEKKVGDL